MAVSSTSVTYTISAWTNNNKLIKCVQGEHNIKLAKFILRDSNSVINLSDAFVVLYSGIKADYSPCWIECTITNAAGGEITLNQYSGMTDVPGMVNGKIIVISSDGNIQFDGINLSVASNPSLATLSNTNAFQALENALNKVQVITPSGTIAIDDELKTNSVNPVQNQVITTIINSILDTKIDKTAAIKFVATNDISDCTENDTIYRVYYNGYYRTLINSYGNYIRAQYLLNSDGKITVRNAEKNNDVWGNWSDWKEFALSGTLLADYGITDVYTKTESDGKFEVLNHKTNSISSSKQTTTADNENYPSVSGLKDFAFGNFYTQDEVDDEIENNRNSVFVYTLLKDSWSNGSQTVSVPASYTVNANTRADIDIDSVVNNQMLQDDCAALYITTEAVNNTPTLIAHYFGNKPSANLTVQIELSVVNTISGQ